MKHLLLFVASVSVAQMSDATEIAIINLDGANEGFNDNTPVSPVGGNTGTTLGEQRLIIFEHAAKIWESILDSPVVIEVEAQLDPLECSSSQGVLGAAGATTVFRDFTNAPISNTWYPIALANSLAGTDLSASPDITATFNSEIDNNNNCLNNTNWYYGLDGNGPSNSIDMLTVVLHEIGHGIGFQTFVDISTGLRLGVPGKNDVFMLNLEDHSRNQTWDQLNNNQRAASATDGPDLHWTGPSVTANLGGLSSGVNQGHVQHYAPPAVELGSSVSHFDTTLTPNELMEPFITQPKSSPGLAVELMADIGWQIFSSISPIISDLADVSIAQGGSVQVQFVIGDEDTDLSTLTFSFDSTDTAVIDQAGFDVSGSGVARTLTITPNGTVPGIANITVTVSDGTNSVPESFQLTVTNTPPVVSIDLPLDNAEFAETDSILFQGTATDTEDGDISAGIQWSSDIDGALGTGNMINQALSAGTHTIDVNVADAGGLMANDSITINIFGDDDGDGMNDLWEINNFGDTSRDGTGDFDGDGITDLDEYLISITIPDGDANGDAQINAADLLLVMQHILGVNNLTALQVARTDIYPAGSPDGIVDVSDYILLQQQALAP